jgi:hypothetical protein
VSIGQSPRSGAPPPAATLELEGIALRNLALILLISPAVFSQSMTEFGAVTAGSAVGGASGKSVSNGISAIFGKVDQQTAKAAVANPAVAKPIKKEVPEPPPVSVVTSDDNGGVPLPPAPHKRAASLVPVAQYNLPQEITRVRSLSDVALTLPPPREMSPEEFHTITTGMPRAAVLRLGIPASKITMFDDGHLLEIYSYHQNGQRFGALRLTDGAVSSIE